MSIVRAVGIFCDGDGCIHATGAEFRDAKEARIWARRSGWTRKSGRDLCPECSVPDAKGGGE